MDLSNYQTNKQEIKYKYLLLGDNPKTLYKIIKIFTEGSFNEDISTIDASIVLPQLSYREGTFNNKLVRMEVIFDSRITRDIIYSTDENIQDFFNSFNAFIIVYQVTDSESFNNLVEWLEIINKFANCNNSLSNKVFLVGDYVNKSLEREISVEKIKNFAINNRCSGFIEISTKDSSNSNNIDNMFVELTNILVNESDSSYNDPQQQQQQYPPPKLSPIPKDSILDTLFKVSVISASIVGLFFFLKSK